MKPVALLLLMTFASAAVAQVGHRPTAPQAAHSAQKTGNVKSVTSMVAGSHSVVLNWTQSITTSPAITGNKIYRGTASGNETLLYTSSTPIVTYTDGPFSTGATYYYRITAVNASGESSYSNEVSAAVPSPPVAPSALALTLLSAPGNHSVVLTWVQSSTTSPAITGNNVYRGTSSGGEVLVYSSNSPIAPFTDGPCPDATTYYYRVTAVNSNGESGYSNEASQAVPSVPASPTSLAATQQ
jgi:predicted phage tail protein